MYKIQQFLHEGDYTKYDYRTLKISTLGNYSGESVKIYLGYIEIKKLFVSDAAEIFSETPISVLTKYVLCW
jgi:hypothetical protein